VSSGQLEEPWRAHEENERQEMGIQKKIAKRMIVCEIRENNRLRAEIWHRSSILPNVPVSLIAARLYVAQSGIGIDEREETD
jgi:hypothetical protein